ncbi:putative membrane-bound spermidine synthase [Rhizobium sp. BK181]|uniref:hypothetical protein n=1 Tax=Rhizobium sp. BK181 TaxID=2587072 RepID=UPI00161BCA64|nr:hypothetical protein [Rhizobium sp. BK181]MBB3319004.1 putative membrane-bound spermidine synthase [Rhizobium sp. BK181]
MNLLKATAIILTAFCGLAAFAIATLPIIFPTVHSTAMLDELFKVMTFLFSTGAGALLFKALG